MTKAAAKTPEAAPVQQPDDFAEKNAAATSLAIPANAPPPATDDLPDSLKKQLVGYAQIELENMIVDVHKALGAVIASVDKIMLTLWHRHKKEINRGKLIRTLNGMVEAGTLVKNDSPRGYSLAAPSGTPAAPASPAAGTPADATKGA